MIHLLRLVSEFGVLLSNHIEHMVKLARHDRCLVISGQRRAGQKVAGADGGDGLLHGIEPFRDLAPHKPGDNRADENRRQGIGDTVPDDSRKLLAGLLLPDADAGPADMVAADHGGSDNINQGGGAEEYRLACFPRQVEHVEILPGFVGIGQYASFLVRKHREKNLRVAALGLHQLLQAGDVAGGDPSRRRGGEGLG